MILLDTVPYIYIYIYIYTLADLCIRYYLSLLCIERLVPKLVLRSNCMTACHASINVASTECQTNWQSTEDIGCQTTSLEESSTTAAVQASVEIVSVECQTVLLQMVDAGCQADNIDL